MSSDTEPNRTKSNGFSLVRLDLLHWIRLVRKLNWHKVWCSIKIDCRTQSNSKLTEIWIHNNILGEKANKQNLESWILNLKFWILNLKSWILNLESWSLKLEAWSLKLEAWSLKLQAWSFKLDWLWRDSKTLFKALVNEDTLLRTHCCSWCFLGCANWETFVEDTKCFWTKSETFFVSRTQNLCPQQMLRVRANGETFVSATMCPQLCVLAC